MQIEYQRDPEWGPTEYYVPVRLCIADTDLFEPWLKVDLIRMATFGMAAIRDAHRRGLSSYTFIEAGPELLFEMDGENVIVSAPWDRLRVKVPYEKLERTWHKFAHDVWDWVRSVTPEEANSPVWAYVDHGPWEVDEFPLDDDVRIEGTPYETLLQQPIDAVEGWDDP